MTYAVCQCVIMYFVTLNEASVLFVLAAAATVTVSMNGDIHSPGRDSERERERE